MATSTINQRFVVKSKKALKQLGKAFENRESLANVKSLTTEEIEKGNRIALEWISRQSRN